MWRFRVVVVVVLVVLVPMPLMTAVHAQDQDAPLVVFVLDQRLATASPFFTGASGLSELERIFQNLGAQTQTVSLSEPLPEEAQVVVVARPLHLLSISESARLWLHLAQGKHLLWALDPWGHNGGYPEGASSTLHQLLALDYGISVTDTFVIAPQFTAATIADLVTAYSFAYPATSATHPVIQPLVSYDLPVQLWGARAIEVDTLGLSSYSVPLVEAQGVYGESSGEMFSTENTPPSLEINTETDLPGEMVVAALAEDTQTGSRIAVLGDSEIVQNGFGLAYSAYTGGEPPPPGVYPIHPGDRVLVERLAAWLLELPIDDWPPLLSGFTWLALDGAGDDWGDVPVVVRDPEDVADSPQDDIVGVKAFHDDSYLYLFIETAAPPGENTGVVFTLRPDPNSDGELEIVADHTITVFQGTESRSTVVDGGMATGEGLEIRLPLRVAGEAPVLDNLCLCVDCGAVDRDLVDCTSGAPIEIPESDTRAPVNVRAAAGPLVTAVSTGSVNLRAGPGTNTRLLGILQNGHQFEAIGRNSAGDWIQVRDARYVGWIAGFLVISNGDLSSLPVVPGS